MTLHDCFVSALGASPSPWLQAAVIVLGTFILEDATTVLVAFAVSAGTLAAFVALGALYVGVAGGDFGLYWGGRLAARHRWARRFVRQGKALPAHGWLKRHAFATVFSARFLPGVRLPTYTAFGFLGISFRKFAIPVVLGTLVWTSLLFGLSVEFGNLVLVHLGAWRWVGAVVAVLAIVAVGRIVARQAAGSSAA
jgi:membrane protein DedA with SNARE-associated domain